MDKREKFHDSIDELFELGRRCVVPNITIDYGEAEKPFEDVVIVVPKVEKKKEPKK